MPGKAIAPLIAQQASENSVLSPKLPDFGCFMANSGPFGGRGATFCDLEMPSQGLNHYLGLFDRNRVVGYHDL